MMTRIACRILPGASQRMISIIDEKLRGARRNKFINLLSRRASCGDYKSTHRKEAPAT